MILNGLLEGKGARIRSVRLSRARDAEIRSRGPLITAAVLQAGWKLDAQGEGRTDNQVDFRQAAPAPPLSLSKIAGARA